MAYDFNYRHTMRDIWWETFGQASSHLTERGPLYGKLATFPYYINSRTTSHYLHKVNLQINRPTSVQFVMLPRNAISHACYVGHHSLLLSRYKYLTPDPGGKYLAVHYIICSRPLHNIWSCLSGLRIYTHPDTDKSSYGLLIDKYTYKDAM